MPVSSSALSTTAPAPSANSTHVLRSDQSSMRVSVSAPITSAVFTVPARMNWSAMLNAYMKPEHAALTSKAMQPFAPSMFCTRQAVDGKIRSGVVVPTISNSTSAPVMPAACIAREPASKARSLVVCPSAAM